MVKNPQIACTYRGTSRVRCLIEYPSLLFRSQSNGEENKWHRPRMIENAWLGWPAIEAADRSMTKSVLEVRSDGRELCDSAWLTSPSASCTRRNRLTVNAKQFR